MVRAIASITVLLMVLLVISIFGPLTATAFSRERNAYQIWPDMAEDYVFPSDSDYKHLFPSTAPKFTIDQDNGKVIVGNVMKFENMSSLFPLFRHMGNIDLQIKIHPYGTDEGMEITGNFSKSEDKLTYVWYVPNSTFRPTIQSSTLCVLLIILFCVRLCFT